MKNTFRKRVAAVLAVIVALCIGIVPVYAEQGAEASPSPSPSPAPTATPWPEPSSAVPAASSIRDDGMLRVYLKSMGDPQILNLTLEGSYTVENDAGFRLARGTKLQLALHNGAIYLNSGGLTMHMGSSFTLTRQEDGLGKPGMRIGESEKDTLYMGDLHVSVGDNGLVPVLHIFVEDYLYGVVAYEMSNSFPEEALRAQAVAARTYAMQRKKAGKKDYDLVDTTADQVFKGYDESYQRVIQAVDSTRGVVGTYKGAYAECFYTASNGGQTALTSDIWGPTGDYGYLSRVEDPYDVENPQSVVRTVSFKADCSDNDTLNEMLLNEVRQQLAYEGVQYTDLRIGEIVGIQPEKPNAEGSLMYEQLRFTLKVQAILPNYSPAEGDNTQPLTTQPPTESQAGQNALLGIGILNRWLLNTPYEFGENRWKQLENDYEVTLGVYDDIKHTLGLNINSTDIELITVEETENGFTLSTRRYGHGVGMSQRGAQQMAGSYGKDYMEILAFYYPGMKVERISWNEPQLKTLDSMPADLGYFRARPTPTPTPAPLPALEDGQYYARVKVEQGSSLNVRQQPTTASPIVTTMSNNRRVIVTGEEADGWVSIKTVEFTGYVKLDYLTAE